jgi:hypothetical protein
MAQQDKKSTQSKFQGFDNGKVADKSKKTVYSPNQVEEMYRQSQQSKNKKNK